MTAPFKPGAHGPVLPAANRPKWYGVPKDAKGRPLRPDIEPEAPKTADTHYQVHPGAALAKPEPLPNKRGAGGRPTKAQARDAGKNPAEEALANIREKDPKTFSVPPRKNSWEKGYNERELSVEQAEAEAILSARQERLQAIKEETTIRQANRRIALGFSSAALRGLNVMNAAMAELGSRDVTKQTVGELQKTITTCSSAVGKAQASIEAMARAERWIMRHPLDINEEKGDDLDGLDAEGARQILENLKGQIDNTVRLFGKRPIVAETSGEEVSK